MKKFALAGAVSLALPLLNAFATPQDEQFEKIAKDYIEGLLQSHPEYATELGDHRFDDRLTDYSDDAAAKELTRANQVRQQLEQLNNLKQL
ncbi:MAG: hypothetical protein ACR2MF_08940, partial [Chthoniobacterales bacterium]